MKNTILSIIAILFLAVGISSAQGIKVGGGLSYGSEISSIGLRADGVYSINKDISVGLTGTYYLPKNDLSWFVVDANAQYNFVKESDLTVYALAGLNMTMWNLSIDMGMFGKIETSGTDTGVNLGAGARKKMGKFELLGEVKYVASGAGFFSLGAGILFPIN
ncbi:MAG: outer membrane beta-barrel protein [Melioribacteraceae bacterium]